MHVAFAHPEPVDPARARWSAIIRTLAAVAERARVTWYTPDPRERVVGIVRRELGLELPPDLRVRTLPSVYRRFGVTWHRVFLRAFRRALAADGADVVWVRSDQLGAYLARRPAGAPPLVFEAHQMGELTAADKGLSPQKARRLARYDREIYDAAAGVAAISAGLLEEIRARFGYRGPAAVAPSAFCPELFRPAWQGGDGCTVVHAGTAKSWKGLGTLLEAIARAPALRLRLVGGGDPAALAALDERISALGIADRVERTGRVPQRELPAAVADAACAVHPASAAHSISRRFTSPLKLVEYMGLGLPIVAGDVPSVREVLTDGEDARLVPAGDAEALARALEEVVGDRALALRLSETSRERAARYTYAARAERLTALLRQAAGAPPDRPPARGA